MRPLNRALNLARKVFSVDFGGGSGGGKSQAVDCDASAILLDQNGKLTAKDRLIYFGNLKSRCGSVAHTGDNLTGAGEGDDEQILVDLSKVPSDVHKIVFVVNIYDCKGETSRLWYDCQRFY